jgi:hypothetical protein
MSSCRRLFAASLSALGVALAGCASTTVDIAGSPLAQPLCRVGAPAVHTVVYWATQWRPDQKEPALREAAALRGIEDFLGRTACLAVVGIHRLHATEALPSDEVLLARSTASSARPERVVMIVVRELGPRLLIGSPAVVEGGTEVLIDVRVLDAQASRSLADARTLWRNGGTFVIQGVNTLDQDMSAALNATLMPGAR